MSINTMNNNMAITLLITSKLNYQFNIVPTSLNGLNEIKIKMNLINNSVFAIVNYEALIVIINIFLSITSVENNENQKHTIKDNIKP